MQNIKIMFRSPRFLLGFCMFMLVIVYAVFWPMINTADPKADREPNPFYDEVQALVAAIDAKDDATIYAELDRLEGIASTEEEITIIQDARAAMDAGGLTRAATGSKQLKKRHALYAEFETLRNTLGATEGVEADEAAAREELANLTAHHEAIIAITTQITEGKYDEALAAIETAGLAEEFAEITALFPKTNVVTPGTAENTTTTEADVEGIAALVSEMISNHEDTYEWVVEIGVRLDAGGYDVAAEAVAAVQKSTLIARDQPPSAQYWFGTDNFSRDIFLEMAYGARLSLTVGLMAGCIATVVGITIGLVAGFVGGMVDNILSTLTNIFIVIPSNVILILIAIALGQMKDAWVTGLIIGLTTWPWTARAVRAQTTSLRHRDHVNMARITGYSMPRIILTEILPYIASYVVMAFILQVAGGIGSEATLAILGLGDPTALSLGRMINWAMNYEAIRNGRWWEFVPVAVCIAMITYGLYLMNSGMDQVFNPKIRS